MTRSRARTPPKSVGTPDGASRANEGVALPTGLARGKPTNDGRYTTPMPILSRAPRAPAKVNHNNEENVERRVGIA